MPDLFASETPAPNAASSSPQRLKETLLAGSIVAAAVVVYVWLISAGTMTRWPTYTAYYDLLARGFLRGQLSLVEQPAPALLKLADPYDPDLNEGLRLHDASLFHGHYYLYWGPLPAMLLAIIRLSPLPAGTKIGDQYLVFGFAIILLVFNALLLLRIRRIAFSGQPWWTVAIPLVAAAFAAPVVFLLGRASIYETAIMGGQCFFVGGLYCALRGLETRVSRGWLLAAGIGWGCAIACRFNLLAPIAGLAGLVAWRMFQLCREWKRRWIAAAFFLSPLVVCGGLLLGYNAARFGSPLEFGTRYQLTWLNGFRAPAANILFSAKYLPPNLDRMWLGPMGILPRFPFLRCGRSNSNSMIHRYHLPREYFPEPIAGLATSLPYAYLAIVAPLMLLARIISRSAKTRCREDQREEKSEILRGHLRAIASSRSPELGTAALKTWLVLCFLAGSVLAMGSVLFVLASTMRYLADVAPALILLASVGMWQSSESSRSDGRRFNILLAGAVFLSVAGAVIGILLALPATIKP